MATRRRKPNEHGQHDPSANTPYQEDEADILAEVEAEPDENGELVVDEAKVREVGAVDVESVRENRRLRAMGNKKKANVKHVNFNTGDVLSKYDTILVSWPPNTIDIFVRRLSGAPVQRTIISRPRSSTELYEALRIVHGVYEEAEYEVEFKDNGTHQFCGKGRIVMPDTRPPGMQQGQHMNPYYPNSGPPVPPGYPPQAVQPPYMQPPPGYPPQQAQPPVVQFVPPAGADPMAMMRQMFDMFQQMQSAVQPPSPQQPQFQSAPVMPPMPSPQASPAEMMAWMQQAFGMFLQMQQGGPRPAQPAVAPPQPAPAPSPQASFAEQISMMREMFTLFQQMQPAPASNPGPNGPYRGPRPPYYPQGDQRPAYGPPPQPPPRQQTPAEQFREAMTTVRTAVDAVREIDTLMPDRGQQEAPMAAEDDDSPIKIIDTGAGKIAVNKGDGSLRLWESGFANLGDVLKWGGEQIQKINKANAERQRQQQPRQQLPPGYVEVSEGYEPPPGYRAVPVDREDDLPPPPEHVPPPISPSRQAWGAPTIPTDDQGEQ